MGLPAIAAVDELDGDDQGDGECELGAITLRNEALDASAELAVLVGRGEGDRRSTA